MAASIAAATGLSGLGLRPVLGTGAQLGLAAGAIDALELEAFEGSEARDDDLVYLLGADEDLDALLAVHLEERRLAEPVFVAAGDVVDGLLPLLHPGLVVREARPAPGSRDLGAALPAHEPEQGFPIREVRVQSLLEGAVELGYELGVFVRIGLGQVGELSEDLLDAGLPDARHDPVLLEDLAAHVERQVLRVDDAADEAQVHRQELFLVVGYEDPLDVELDPRAVVRAEEVEGGLGGDIEEGRILDRALGLGMDPMKGRVFALRRAEFPEPRAGEGLVEAHVVLVLELGFRPPPQGRGGIDDLLLALDSVLLALVVVLGLLGHQGDGIGYVVGIFLEHRLDAPAAEVLLALAVEVDAHFGSLTDPLGGLDRVLSLALARPGEGGLSPGLAARHLDLVRDHEGRIESDSELADEVGVLFRVLGEAIEESPGAGPRDGAQVLLELLLVHPDPVVLDHDGLVLFVDDYLYRRLEGDGLEGLVGDAEVAQLVYGVGCVGNELAEENLLMRVEGVDDEVEEARNLRLEMVLRHVETPEISRICV